MKLILSLALLGSVLSAPAFAGCSYTRICNSQGQCEYKLVCDNDNIPNPGDRGNCGYKQVCDNKGCRYEYTCK